MNRKNRGFTLLELLVVIAVIGILVIVVIALTRGSKNKSEDAKTRQVLANVRNSAAEELVQNNTYVGICSGTGKTATVVNTLAAQRDLPPSGYTCVASGTEYAVVFPLKSVSNTYWCVDAAGNAMATGGATFSGAPYNCTKLPPASSGATSGTSASAQTSTPLITLLGSTVKNQSPVYYSEPSYTASDTVDGNITNMVTFNTAYVSYVQTGKFGGTCTVRRTYRVTNTQGRSAQATRTFAYSMTNIEAPICATELDPQ